MHTFVSATGHRRGGEVELAYASFLSSGSVATQVLKQGQLKKRAESGNFSAALYEKWNDRHVALRGNFICVGKINHGAHSKVHMISSVSNCSGNYFTVTCTSHSKLYFRAANAKEKEGWVCRIRDAIAHADSLPHMADQKPSEHSSWIGKTNFPDSSLEFGDIFRSRSTEAFASEAPEGIDNRSPSSPLEPLARSSSAPQSPTAKRPLCQRTVGVFWDTTTVRPTEESDNIDATKIVREYAQQLGHVKVFKAYAEAENPGDRSVRNRMDKDLSSLVRDQTKQATSESTIVIISDRALLETAKEVADRGAKVIVVNSRVDKTIAVSPTSTIEFKRSSHSLWVPTPYCIGSKHSPSSSGNNTPRQEEHGRNCPEHNSAQTDSDLEPESSPSPTASPLVCAAGPRTCDLAAKFQQLDVVGKRPVAVTPLLVFANVLLAILLVWVA